jgi:hypothetical protein
MDASKSMENYAVQPEVVQVVEALPPGSRLVILAVRGHTEKLFDDVLTPPNRAIALDKVRAVTPTGLQTDLGEAMAKATFELMNHPGLRKVYVFTDGRHLPLRESIYRGRTFQALLDRPDLPNDIFWAIRVFGNTPLTSNKPNLAILRSASDWAGVLGPPPARPAPTRTVPLPPVPQPSQGTAWRLAGYVVLLVLGLAGIGWLVQQFRRRHAAAIQEMFARMRMPVVAAAVELPEPTEPKQSYTISNPTTGDCYTLERDPDEVIIGGGWDVDFRVCDDPQVRVRVRIQEGQLTFANLGEADVAVGAEIVPPGRVSPLPSAALVFALGKVRLLFARVVEQKTEPSAEVARGLTGGNYA